MNYKNLDAIMRGILDDPTSQIAVLHEDRSLWLKGTENRQALCYAVASPLGTIAEVNGMQWEAVSSESDLPMQVGFLSDDKILLVEDTPEFRAHYCDQDIQTEDDLYFVLFAYFKDYADAYIVTPTIGAPVHLRWPPEKGYKLFGLCSEIITANDPVIGQLLYEFLLKAAYPNDDD